MKKFIIILATLVTAILLAAIIIPVIYKDDIRKLVENTIDENVDATVYFDPSKFGLTLFKNFPDLTASIGDFGIVGEEAFAGDTLISIGSLNVSIDLFSLFGNNYRIKSIDMVKPRINVIYLKSGQANFEIVASSEETSDAPTEETTDFNLAINNWSISEGYLRYFDHGMDMEMILDGLEHRGSGNISLDVYDLETSTTVKKAMLNYEGIKYLNGQALVANAIININMPEFKFTFEDSQLKVNDFPFTVDGFVAMPAEDIDMDIAFSSQGSSIKSLYSLVPGVFTEGYENIRAEGDLTFSGFARGKYNETSMPAFKVQLKAAEGMISYPDLPAPINNINIDMLVDCADGVIENTSVHISKFHMDMGNNPINGSLLIRNLRDYSMNADISAELDLAELSSIFPIEGTEMKGFFSMNLQANGVYDSVKNIMPTINASMLLKDGYIKSSEFPKALENMSFNSEVVSANGKMEDMLVKVEDFKMAMEGEELTANLVLKNMVDYQWDLEVKGSLDLEVLSEIYPIEGMNYSGQLKADIQTTGKYSDVEAEKYDRFPTSGNVALSDFVFASEVLPQGMKIFSTKISLDPRRINVESFDGTLGKSDLKLQGSISNYIDYVFKENALLKGNMNLTSNLMDLNEFMAEEEVVDATASGEDTTAMEAVIIPRNIDFEFQSSVKKILYDNLQLQNAKGMLTVRDGVLDMSDLSFNMLGGTIVMNGNYDTRVPDNPAFAYQLNIQQVSIPQAYTSFSTVQAFAPMAQLMNGNFSSNFKINGKLKDDMTPVFESLNGQGLIQIAEAFVKESKLVSGISGFMKSDMGSTQLSLKDVIMKASLENGRAHVSPFDVQLARQKATISGSIGADGSLDYRVNTEVDAGVVGQQVNQLLATLKGDQATTASSKIKLHFNVGGTYDKPKFNLAGTTSEDGATTTVKEQVKQEVKQEVNQQVESAKKEAEAKVQEETKKIIDQGEKQIQQQMDTLKKEVTKNLEEEAGKVIGEELDSTANELKESLKNLFKKKKKN
jgi:uncharacterized protein involved in outer membrane biogenesis